MQLGQIKCPRGAVRKPKRLGQGIGSGTGKTAGKGHGGQRSRSGANRGRRTGFEGGQMPLHRRIPKIGFTNHNRVTYQVVNLGDIEARGLEGTVGPEELRQSGLIRRVQDPVKILGDGALSKGLSLRAHKFSQSAIEKINQAGGQAEVI
ncbi:MAG: 50S ribosomal protein L15 [Candidatus Latescibacteria bacterium]|nr:50S ribosomal protein L15 [Candidatus Latescibacterota bacterium]